MEAFELEAFDYILKPYQESRIINMLQKLTTAWQQQNNAASGLASAAPRENDTINPVSYTHLALVGLLRTPHR